MSLILVKDNANSKIRELECDSNGLLKVDKVDVSALATQATLSSLNGKVTACDTSALATQATLSALNTKVTACDTGSISGTVAVSAVSGNVACTHASLPLPSGASTSANQATGNTSLATLAGCVSANKVAVTSVPSTPSATHLYMWGDASAGESVSNNTDQFSDSVDVDAYNKISVFGSSTNLSDEFEFQASHNNSNWFEITSQFVQVDYSSGEFGFVSDAPFKYIRLKKKGTGGGGSDTVWAIVSAK